MNKDRLKELLHALPAVRVAVIGDFALDAYWLLDPTGSETSLETGRTTQAVRTQHYTLGGAGNVVANLRALGVEHVQAIGVIGPDPFGRELGRMLSAAGVDTRAVATQHTGWDTLVFGKPHVAGVEQPRLDFGAFNQPEATTEQHLLDAFRAALPHVHAIVINQQARSSFYSDALIAGINDWTAAHSTHVFVVDSRDLSSRFTGVSLKLNAAEASRLAGVPCAPGAVVPLDDTHEHARLLFERTRRPAFITRGAHGLTSFDGQAIIDVSGIDLPPPIDPVGAGDAAVAALAAALAAGATAEEAAHLANLAAAVTVRKLQQCGTATPTEISELVSHS